MIQEYKSSDLILTVEKDANIENLISIYEPFMNAIFDEKYYFLKEAGILILRYLLNDKYEKVDDLAKINFAKNVALQDKYGSEVNFTNSLQLNGKKSCSVDLATGTGKSYLIYAIAQIALHSGLVDQVLVLCPSNTIEDGLNEKFNNFAGDANLRDLLPKNHSKLPRIISANQTIVKGDICIENIHAVYANTNSSIKDSLYGKGERTLILNDEAHHIFNKVEGSDKQNIKEWKKFIQNKDFNFKYIVNFSGTPYIGNEYFSDVIYQFSLRQAIEENIVKSPNWLINSSVESANNNYQIMYQNHLENKMKYFEIKPLTIVITSDINKCYEVYEKLVKFLAKKENTTLEKAKNKVIWVVSSKPSKGSEKERLANLKLLKSVDNPESPIEWIISVSMLTEGWDVKNVFQIVPHDSRAFNSKLLIAQVLGRGLRVPQVYSERTDLKVRVFNHEKFSKEIKRLFDEVLDIDDRLQIPVVVDSPYHFTLNNLSYKPVEKNKYDRKPIKGFDGNFNLKPQARSTSIENTYQNIIGEQEEKTFSIELDFVNLSDGLNNIYSHIKGIDIEKGTNFANQYSISRISELLKNDSQIKNDDFISKENLNIIKNSFYKLWDFGGETITYEKAVDSLIKVSTKSIIYSPSHANSFRKYGSNKLFVQEDYSIYLDEIEKRLFLEILENRDDFKIDEFSEIKSPSPAVLGNHSNENKFLNKLLNKSNVKNYDGFFKNPDKGFYSFPYAYKKATHMVYQNFNPDFFIKKGNKILVVEIKDDKEESLQTRAKLYAAEEHFKQLNLQQTEHEYVFVLLSPSDYDAFFIALSKSEFIAFQTNLMNRLKSEIDAELDSARQLVKGKNIKTLDGVVIATL